ncbi:MAG TPA: DUF4097 family beta strand repeat-containing protein [Candidatus Angelobacter sp.]
MKKLGAAILGGILLAGPALAMAAESARQTRLAIVPGGSVNVVNRYGSVTLHPGSPHQLVVNATTHSDKVEVDANSVPDGKRIDIRTHALPQQRPTSSESSVDYDIAIPSGVSVTITTATAPITVDNIGGDLSLSSDTGLVTVKNAVNTHLEVRGVAAPVVLSDVTGQVEVTSSGGNVQLTHVSGPRVRISTTSGNITYHGDFSTGGSYLLSTHSGNIDVTLPEKASVDLSAQSLKGSVENDYPLQAKSHMTFVPDEGRSFAGTSNSGSSSVELESFSGRIRVKKQ